jgi:hypothetical protein
VYPPSQQTSVCHPWLEEEKMIYGRGSEVLSLLGNPKALGLLLKTEDVRLDCNLQSSTIIYGLCWLIYGEYSVGWFIR